MYIFASYQCLMYLLTIRLLNNNIIEHISLLKHRFVQSFCSKQPFWKRKPVSFHELNQWPNFDKLNTILVEVLLLDKVLRMPLQQSRWPAHTSCQPVHWWAVPPAEMEGWSASDSGPVPLPPRSSAAEVLPLLLDEDSRLSAQVERSNWEKAARPALYPLLPLNEPEFAALLFVTSPVAIKFYFFCGY